jgi:predicted NUDIX family NTP pyrophosphohydrolase
MAARRRLSAGTLLYRQTEAGPEVLLVHHAGGYNRRAPWNLPKGELEAGESAEEAARRETEEETGLVPGSLTDLGHIDYRRSAKRVFAFAGPAPPGAEPRCASWEIDQAVFLPLAAARERIHPDLLPFLDRLEALLARSRQ